MCFTYFLKHFLKRLSPRKQGDEMPKPNATKSLRNLMLQEMLRREEVINYLVKIIIMAEELKLKIVVIISYGKQKK